MIEPSTSDASGSGEFWSDELEELHEESSRTHFLDVWNRQAIIERLGALPTAPLILDAGCSTGYLMEDLARDVSGSRLVGIDYVYAGLPLTRANVPGATFVQADATRLPFPSESFDGVVSANLLEHVPDHVGALRELARVLRPGARAVVVVPSAPGLYDYYDRFLHHQRRYGRNDLTGAARAAGLVPTKRIWLGSLLYPAFFLVKKRNRWLRGHLEGDALTAQVTDDIGSTKDSSLGRLLCAIERRALDRGVVLPFGVRQLAVLERPATAAAEGR